MTPFVLHLGPRGAIAYDPFRVAPGASRSSRLRPLSCCTRGLGRAVLITLGSNSRRSISCSSCKACPWRLPFSHALMSRAQYLLQRTQGLFTLLTFLAWADVRAVADHVRLHRRTPHVRYQVQSSSDWNASNKPRASCHCVALRAGNGWGLAGTATAYDPFRVAPGASRSNRL